MYSDLSKTMCKAGCRCILGLGLFASLGCSIPTHDGMSQAAPQAPSIYDLKAKTIEGEAVDFASYRGKVLLIVNTASRCGFTTQYTGLQKLNEKYRDKGFLVLGFPSNDFGNREPGTNKDVSHFCKLSLGIDFPIFEKAPVSGPQIQPVYKFLTQTASPQMSSEVAWNFEKFLLDRSGHLRSRYGSFTAPESHQLEADIEVLLGEDAA